MSKEVKEFEELRTLFGSEQVVELTTSSGQKVNYKVCPLPITKFADLLRAQVMLSQYRESKEIDNPGYDESKANKDGVMKNDKGQVVPKKINVVSFKADTPSEMYQLIQDLIVYALAYTNTPKEERDNEQKVKENEKKVSSLSVTLAVPLLQKILAVNNIGDSSNPQDAEPSDSVKSVQGNQK